MSESYTIFNEPDRRGAAVQLMLSTDPSYDNRTIASTLKMQIRRVQRLRAQHTHRTNLWKRWSGRPHHAPSHLRSRLESQYQIVPGCAEECGDPLVQSGGRWQTLGVAAGLGAGPLAPLLPRPEPTGLLRLVIRREHHQHDLPQHQIQPDRRHLPSSRQRLWKRHAARTWSVSRQWLRPKAATLNRYQLYYIIKLPELIFSIKVLK